MFMRNRFIGMVLLCAGSLAAQAPAPQTIKGLGTITFPTSTKSAAAQRDFIRGVLLLHVFEYDDAAASFRAAQKLDSGFVMAYWGEAMTYTHPVWDQQDLAAAQAVLARLKERHATERESMYLAAVEQLYGAGPKAKRDTLYSDAMHKIVLAYPKDDEARAFYALSLLGLSQGVRNVPTYLAAAAIAESIYHRNPDHPGAEHYWIHGMDDPEHAPAALTAARALSKTAPDAGHSQHMTTHIFLAMGMWDDVVSQNEIAIHVVDSIRKSRGRGPVHCGHYPSWLSYGYGMQGRFSASRRAVAACHEDNPKADAFIAMWMRYVLDSQDWTGEVAGWGVEPAADGETQLDYQFLRGYVAAQRGALPVALQAAGIFDSVARTFEVPNGAAGAPDPEMLEFQKVLRALSLELHGLIAVKNGAVDSGLALIKRATIVEDSTAAAFGPPAVDQPSYELYGEQLLAAGHPKEALAAFRTALARAPRRTPALLGLARSAKAAHDDATAKQAYQQLVDIWHAADPGNPNVAEARAGAGGTK
jgi:tetratricopeptide (TPR) repeat protein